MHQNFVTSIIFELYLKLFQNKFIHGFLLYCSTKGFGQAILSLMNKFTVFYLTCEIVTGSLLFIKINYSEKRIKPSITIKNQSIARINQIWINTNKNKKVFIVKYKRKLRHEIVFPIYLSKVKVLYIHKISWKRYFYWKHDSWFQLCF